MTPFKPKSMQAIETVTLILQIKEETDNPICFLKENEASLDKDGSFSYASTVEFSKSIYLHAIPKGSFTIITKNIEKILVHEQIHLALYALGLDDASDDFDNLFPMLNDFEKWIEEKDKE